MGYWGGLQNSRMVCKIPSILLAGIFMEKLQPVDCDCCGRLLMFVLNVETVQRR